MRPPSIHCGYCGTQLAPPMYGATTVMCPNCRQYTDLSGGLVPHQQQSLSPARGQGKALVMVLGSIAAIGLVIWVTGISWVLLVLGIGLAIGAGIYNSLCEGPCDGLFD